MTQDEHNWNLLLQDHPILSHHHIPSYKTDVDSSVSAFRRQVMCLKDADLIIAVGSELRILAIGDLKRFSGSQISYKILHTPNIRFCIHQITLNSTGKLLAVAGAFEVGVVVLPRRGYLKHINTGADCRSLHVGRYYHAGPSSPQIMKIEWHPWGESGATLLVMTVDGKLREYDITVDFEEPQQTLSFSSERQRGSFIADDKSGDEAVSFTIGKGEADWGPLTAYALMRNGDIFSICPYMPQNACIPKSFVFALQCYVNAKQESLNNMAEKNMESFATLYYFQHKYINALLKQLPLETSLSSSSQMVSMHPPFLNIKLSRQGPFLLQPSPPERNGDTSGDATDIIYMAYPKNSDDDEVDTNALKRRVQLGVVLVSFNDGRIDVYLDVEKIEAKWEFAYDFAETFPMFSVYEVIDLGTSFALSKGSDSDAGFSDILSIQGNHPIFHLDSIYEDRVHVYHTFGVHTLNVSPLLTHLTNIINEEGDDAFLDISNKQSSLSVRPILKTVSSDRRSSDPITAVVISKDAYSSCSIFVITSTMSLISCSLNLHTNSSDLLPLDDFNQKKVVDPNLCGSLPTYLSLLDACPFAVPELIPGKIEESKFPGRPSSLFRNNEIQVTPESLRFLGATVQRFMDQIRNIELVRNTILIRTDLQQKENIRQHEKSGQLLYVINLTNGPPYSDLRTKLRSICDSQRLLLSRMDRILQILMNGSSPDLNEHETKWFDELGRIRRQIIGCGTYDANSMRVRLQLLQKDLDGLSVSLADLKASDNERAQGEKYDNFSFSQSYTYHRQSKAQSVKLNAAVKQLSRLVEKLNLSETSLGGFHDKDSTSK